ncbi:hypothetical protein [Psychrobacter sanguinis]|uniref:hypothetical protein n=1 Tax=Psychrobacter sanguinis TaxID=861445 RepID=UPI001918CCA1|nr:hypothetical protein [Psychrobacter sanguinis]MCC3309212.1 hypothetical protein [Psychrobacter sanguinis]UEC26491.1 hypothetical protein LK453_05075 [Psychrobacter sanguinis]
MRIKHIISITSLLSIASLATASISCDKNSVNKPECNNVSMYQTVPLDTTNNSRGIKWLANHFVKTRSDNRLTYSKDPFVATGDNKANTWKKESFSKDISNEGSICRINSFGMTICN